MRHAAAALAAAIAVAGCSAISDGEDGGRRDGVRELRTIVYVNPLPNNPLWDRIGECLEKDAKAAGVAVRTVGPPGGNVNIQAMQSLISQAIANDADAIATWSAGAPEAFDALFRKARARGIPTVTFISSGSTKDHTVDIGEYPRNFARLQIEAVARRPGRQRLGVLAQGAKGAGYDEYVQGIKDAVDDHPNVELEAITFNQGTFTNDVSLVSTMLAAHPEINVLTNYSGFPGVLTAIREKRRVGKVQAVISSDFPDAVAKDIEDGLVAGVRVVPACRMGRMAAARLLDVAAGRKVAKHYDAGDRIVSGREFLRLARQGRL